MNCSSCGEEAEGKHVDFGIGRGEFWGAPFNDVQVQFVSACCEADLMDGRFPVTHDPDNYGPDEDDPPASAYHRSLMRRR